MHRVYLFVEMHQLSSSSNPEIRDNNLDESFHELLNLDKDISNMHHVSISSNGHSTLTKPLQTKVESLPQCESGSSRKKVRSHT